MKPGQAYQERSIELIKFCRVLLEEFSSDKLRRSHDRGTDRDWCAVLKTEQALESAKAAKDRHTHSANEAFIAAQGACEKTFLDATELRIFQKAMQEAKDKDDDYMRTRTESFAILRVFKKKRKAS